MHEPSQGLPHLTEVQLDSLLDELSTPPSPAENLSLQQFEECSDAFHRHCRYRWRSPESREPEDNAERAVIAALKRAVDSEIFTRMEGIDPVLYPHLKFERSVAREQRVLVRSDRGEFRSAFLLEVNNPSGHSLIFAGSGWAKFERAPVYSAILSGLDPKMYSHINIYSPPAFEEGIDQIEDFGDNLFHSSTQTSSILAAVLCAVERCPEHKEHDRSSPLDLEVRRRRPGRAEIYIAFESKKFLVDVELVPNLLNVLAIAKPIN